MTDYKRAEDLVRREVLCCVSSLVSTLASGSGYPNCLDYASRSDSDFMQGTADFRDLCEQALELACPVDDWEEAARQAGWEPFDAGDGSNCYKDTTDNMTWACADWRELCEAMDIDPYQWEIFEHWAVSGWLADALEAVGEKVDKDFAGLCVWARTTTGQAIAMDPCIARVLELSDKRLEELRTA